jgi:hypothetical protein
MKKAVFWVCGAVDRLMMKAASTSETSVNFYQTTRRNNPEDSLLDNSCVRLGGNNFLVLYIPVSISNRILGIAIYACLKSLKYIIMIEVLKSIHH